MAEPLKICSLCKEAKSADGTCFYTWRRSRDGLTARCKTCVSASRKLLRTPEKAAKNAAYCRAWSEKNRDAVRAAKKAKFAARTPEQRDQRIAKQRADRAANREAINAYHRSWRAQNPQSRIAAEHNRRARHRNAKGSIRSVDVQRLFDSQKGRCWWCSCKMKEFDVDHRFALADGGTNELNNLVASCRPCNRSKQDRKPWETANPRLL